MGARVHGAMVARVAWEGKSGARCYNNSAAGGETVSKFLLLIARSVYGGGASPKLKNAWLNRGLPRAQRVALRVAWPLWLLPVILVNQILVPHAVWVVLLVMLGGLYGLGYLWARGQVGALRLTRRRMGAILVAGDVLQEEHELQNAGVLPVIWAEIVDHSTLPTTVGQGAGRVVACDARSSYRWRTATVCEKRGVFRLGPRTLRLQDPFGLFAVTVEDEHQDTALIYPRVVQLPEIQLPRGAGAGVSRHRRPLLGNLPAATVTDYRPGDSLRHIHWATSARTGKLMVKEVEAEPGGQVWLVADLDGAVQRGAAGAAGTLETVVTVTASLAAALLSGREPRAVGMLAFGRSEAQGRVVEVMPSRGVAHLWSILAALAPLDAGDHDLAALLRSAHARLGTRNTVMLVTPQLHLDDGDAARNWLAELVHLQQAGVGCSVALVILPEEHGRAAQGTLAQLARLDIPATVIEVGDHFPAWLTFRRRRRIVRTTPTGGVVSYEVDEEVG
jgi:uncharacterized protein (DUF58 family)